MAIINELLALIDITRTEVERGERAPEELSLLQRALEAFTRGRLRDIVVGPGIDTLHATCNLRITDSALAKEHREFLRSLGVQLVGEASYIRFKQSGKAAPHFRQLGSHILTTLGLPPGYDPLRNGWRPSYWDNHIFLASLEIRCAAAFGTRTVGAQQYLYGTAFGEYVAMAEQLSDLLMRHHIDRLGQYLPLGRTKASCAREDAWSIANLRLRQTELRDTPLWAAALVPPDWQPTMP